MPGSGRKKGTPNKITGDLRAMVLQALDRAGGVAYLTEKAESHPQAFMALVGKCLPKDVNIDAKVTLEDLLAHANRRMAERGVESAN